MHTGADCHIEDACTNPDEERFGRKPGKQFGKKVGKFFMQIGIIDQFYYIISVLYKTIKLE